MVAFAPVALTIYPASDSLEKLIGWLQDEMTNSDFYLTRGVFFWIERSAGTDLDRPRSWGGGGQQGRKGMCICKHTDPRTLGAGQVACCKSSWSEPRALLSSIQPFKGVSSVLPAGS